eukprot:m51a1_g5435 hypothetical protein (314) ;mRNA; f:164656-165597
MALPQIPVLQLCEPCVNTMPISRRHSLSPFRATCPQLRGQQQQQLSGAVAVALAFANPSGARSLSPIPSFDERSALMTLALNMRETSAETLRAEYERKAAAMSTALKAKSDELAHVSQALEAAEKRIVEVEHEKDSQKAQLEARVRELESKLELDRQTIKELAQKNARLTLAAIEKHKAAEASGESLEEARKRADEYQKAAAEATSKLTQVASELQAREQENIAAAESIALYEARIRQLEKEMQDNLRKEFGRRLDAERFSEFLGMRVRELERNAVLFRVAGDDDSDSDSGSDSDSDSSDDSDSDTDDNSAEN